MIFDSHIHIGQFYQRYFSPTDISALISKCGVSYYLVSSTSICEGNIQKCLNEIGELINIDGLKVFPCLWLTEDIIKTNMLSHLLNSPIKWSCLKIHPALHPYEWVSLGKGMKDIIELARYLSIPILIHTGYDDICSSAKYEKDIATNPDIKFILAHGRPFYKARDMLNKYNNVYVDTSFMPANEIVELMNTSISDRIMWGSDTPIPFLYYDIDQYENYYRDILQQLYNTLSNESYEKLVFSNAFSLFNHSSIL